MTGARLTSAKDWALVGAVVAHPSNNMGATSRTTALMSPKEGKQLFFILDILLSLAVPFRLFTDERGLSRVVGQTNLEVADTPHAVRVSLRSKDFNVSGPLVDIYPLPRNRREN